MDGQSGFSNFFKEELDHPDAENNYLLSMLQFCAAELAVVA